MWLNHEDGRWFVEFVAGLARFPITLVECVVLVYFFSAYLFCSGDLTATSWLASVDRSYDLATIQDQRAHHTVKLEDRQIRQVCF